MPITDYELLRSILQAAIEDAIERTLGLPDYAARKLRLVGRLASIMGENFEEHCPISIAGLYEPGGPDWITRFASNYDRALIARTDWYSDTYMGQRFDVVEG